MGAKKLWHKGQKTNQQMQRLCTANDPEIDTQLIWFDCLGSLGQAKMLQKMGIYSAADAAKVAGDLRRIAGLSAKGKITVNPELEDCHTLIESELTKKLGALGKKIHTGRSRNDQAALMMRLFMRRQLVEIMQQAEATQKLLEKLFVRQGKILIPGYTHLQPAMPASVGMWVHSFYEAMLRFQKQALQYYEIINVCPLGSGAGFGSSLKLDRAVVAKFLGFADVQRSFIDVNNSRGRIEEGFLQLMSGLAFVADKFASDLMLFLSKEFALVRLADALKTGSSIMPQKNNPDLVELLRGRAAQLRATQIEETLIINKLATSYHRDLQFTKEPLLRGARLAAEILESMQLLLGNLDFDAKRAEQLLYPELFATYQANRLVQKGATFRDAYVDVAKSLAKAELKAADFSAELAEPLKQTALGFKRAVAENKKFSKLAIKTQQTERALTRLLA